MSTLSSQINKIPEAKRKEVLHNIAQSINEQIDVRHLLSALDAEIRDGGPDPLTVRKYKVHDKGIGNIIISADGRWQAVNLNNTKGFGALSFLTSVMGYSYMNAITYLSELFDFELNLNNDKVKLSGNIEKLDKSDVKIDVNAPKILNLPPARPQYARDVIDYLNTKRNIPLELIDETMERGTLYPARYSYLDDDGVEQWETRCIFRGESSAESRSVRSHKDAFKGAIKGSNPTISGIPFPHNKNALKTSGNKRCMVLVEAAIDAMSYRAMFPDRYAFSCNGAVSRFPLQYLSALDGLKHNIDIKIALDADDAGDKASQILFNAITFRHQYSAHYNIDPAKIDDLILNEKIRFQYIESPHCNFFNSEKGWEEKMPVYEDGKEIGMGEPMYRFTVIENLKIKTNDGKTITLDKGTYDAKVSRNDWIYLTCNIMRERPNEELKDWNQELVTLGVSFLREYSLASEQNFDILPKLPDHLLRFRYHNSYKSDYVAKIEQETKEILKQEPIKQENKMENSVVKNEQNAIPELLLKQALFVKDALSKDYSYAQYVAILNKMLTRVKSSHKVDRSQDIENFYLREKVASKQVTQDNQSQVIEYENQIPNFDDIPPDMNDLGYDDHEHHQYYDNFGILDDDVPVSAPTPNNEKVAKNENIVNGHIAVEKDSGAINNPIDIALAPKDSQQIETPTAMKF
jgi:hypothetical protein